jgi:hypothetical protein
MNSDLLIYFFVVLLLFLVNSLVIVFANQPVQKLEQDFATKQDFILLKDQLLNINNTIQKNSIEIKSLNLLEKINVLDKKISNIDIALQYFIMKDNVRSDVLKGNGSNGMFSNLTQKIVLETKERNLKDICFIFLHELGHAKEFKEGLFDKHNKKESEEYANNYMNENIWRCEAI